MTDTAEYWDDVKNRKVQGPNDMVYHDPDFICDNPKRQHHKMALFVEEVNCHRCNSHIKLLGTKLLYKNAPDISLFNFGQNKAYELITAFLKHKNQTVFVLEGYAGTGKTFLIKQVVKYIRQEFKKWSIAATAPTNKAVKVLQKSASIDDPEVQYMTIHKLLGLKENIDENGKQSFIKGFDPEGVSINDFGVLIIDEVSMLSDELFLGNKDCPGIYEYRDRIKIIFMGDPAQIPPVGKENCIPFHAEEQLQYKFERFTLTEIMRQRNENPIVSCSFHIRENLKEYNPLAKFTTQYNDEGKGIIRFNSGDPDQRKQIDFYLNTLFNSEAFKQDADHCKVIAYKNNTVNSMNAAISKRIFGNDITKIMKGEKLIANNPIFSNKAIIFSTSDEFEVIGFDVKEEPLPYPGANGGFKYYNCMVECWMPGNLKLNRRIDVLHEQSEAAFNKMVDEFRQRAIASRSKYDWKRFYEVYRHFADVGYNYSITAHKSQGSTYKNVFIIDDDITSNSKVVERNRIKYTACSRPTDKLIIISNQ